MDTSKLTPFEKLDLVLEYASKITMPPFRTFTEIKNELDEKEIIFGAWSDELFRIISKLEDDKNLTTELDSKGIKRYYPNFDGNLFISLGGYVHREVDRLGAITELENLRKLESRLKEKAVEQNRQLIFAGSFAAVFSGGILILELVKYFDPPEYGHLELTLWVGIAILCLVLRIAIPKIFP